MKARLEVKDASPGAYRAMLGLEEHIGKTSLERPLIELVKMRASQINGCAYCIDMHAKDARAAGESEQRLYALTAWRETPFYTGRERAALAWAEAVTVIANRPVSDAEFEEARHHFSERELADLTLVCVTINGWNRFCVAFQAVPGEYQPAQHAATKGAS